MTKEELNHYMITMKGPGALEFITDQDELSCIKAVRMDPSMLQFVKDQTPEICLEAVKRDGLMLQYVKDQTEQICLEAIAQNGLALQYVHNQTEEMCILAICNNLDTIKYVKNITDRIKFIISGTKINTNKTDDELKNIGINLKARIQAKISNNVLFNVPDSLKSEEICLNAVKQSGLSLVSVVDQTEEICLEAVKQNGLALQYVKNQTEEICLEAVKQNGLALQYVKNQTEEICMIAITKDASNIQYVKDQTEEICLFVVKKKAYLLQHIKNQTEEICLEAVKQNGLALRYIDKNQQTIKMCLEAVKQNGMAIRYIEKQMEEMCEIAVKDCGISALRFVKKQTKNICELAFAREIYKRTLKSVHPLEIIDNKFKTKEICIEAIKKFGPKSINFIPSECIDQDIVDILLEQDIYSIKYIPQEFITEKICINYINSIPTYNTIYIIPKECITQKVAEVAIFRNFDNIQYIPEEYITQEIADYVYKQDISCIRYIPCSLRTYEMCKQCAEYDTTTHNHYYINDFSYFEYIPKEYYNINNHEIENMYIKYLNGYLNTHKSRSYSVVKNALKIFINSELILGFLISKHPKRLFQKVLPDEYKTESICRVAVELEPENIEYINNPSEETCLIVINKTSKYNRYIASLDNVSENVLNILLSKSASLIRYVKNPTEELYLKAIESNCYSIRYMDKEIITDTMYSKTIENIINDLLKDMDNDRAKNILNKIDLFK